MKWHPQKPDSMEYGILSTRYARALLDFAQSKGAESVVYQQMRALTTQWREVPQLQEVLNDPLVQEEVKLHLLVQAIGSPVCPELERFFRLVLRHKRENYLEVIGLIYGKLYRKLKRMIQIDLYTAQPVEPETKRRLQELLQVKEGLQIELAEHIDPALIGGFILRTDGERLDASIASQLRRFRQQLTYRNDKQMYKQEK